MCSYGQVSIMCQDSFLVCDPHGMKYSTIRASNVNLFTELDHQVLNLVGDCLILIEYPVKRQLVGGWLFIPWWLCSFQRLHGQPLGLEKAEQMQSDTVLS